MLSQQHFLEVGIPARELTFWWGVGIPLLGFWGWDTGCGSEVGIPENHWFYKAFAFCGDLWWVGIPTSELAKKGWDTGFFWVGIPAFSGLEYRLCFIAICTSELPIRSKI